MSSEQPTTDGFAKSISEIISNIDAHARRIQQLASGIRSEFAAKRSGTQIVIDPNMVAVKKLLAELQGMAAGLDNALKEFKHGV